MGGCLDHQSYSIGKGEGILRVWHSEWSPFFRPAIYFRDLFPPAPKGIVIVRESYPRWPKHSGQGSIIAIAQIFNR